MALTRRSSSTLCRGPGHMDYQPLMGTTCQVVFAACSAFLPLKGRKPSRFLPPVLFLFPQLSPGRGHTVPHQRNCLLFSTDKVPLTLATNGSSCNDDSLGCTNMIRLQSLCSLERGGLVGRGLMAALGLWGDNQKEPGCSPW